MWMKLWLLLPSAALGLFLIGCASPHGSKFALSGDAALTPPPGQALIFLMRTPNLVDSANSWIVGLNGKHLVTVPNGGYHLFTNAPGTLKFTSRFEDNLLNFGLATFLNKDREVLKFDAQPDTTYYLKLFVGQLTELPPDEGRVGLAKCKKILPEAPKAPAASNATAKRVGK